MFNGKHTYVCSKHTIFTVTYHSEKITEYTISFKVDSFSSCLPASH